jgi:hypothetical protein
MTMNLSTIRLVAVVASAILLTVSTGVHAKGRGPVGLGGTPTKITGASPTAYFGRYGWGYGRGWCYWHPYACYYR